MTAQPKQKTRDSKPINSEWMNFKHSWQQIDILKRQNGDHDLDKAVSEWISKKWTSHRYKKQSDWTAIYNAHSPMKGVCI